MRKEMLATAFGLALSSAVSAAEIHGTLSESDKPVSGAALTLDCGGTAASAKTDDYGSYSLKIEATGECHLSLERGGASLGLKVTVYDKPSRYDLVLATDGGRPVLRRK
jgi:hypothetical protein